MIPDLGPVGSGPPGSRDRSFMVIGISGFSVRWLVVIFGMTASSPLVPVSAC
jgi:hypothetical protein